MTVFLSEVTAVNALLLMLLACNTDSVVCRPRPDAWSLYGWQAREACGW